MPLVSQTPPGSQLGGAFCARYSQTRVGVLQRNQWSVRCPPIAMTGCPLHLDGLGKPSLETTNSSPTRQSAKTACPSYRPRLTPRPHPRCTCLLSFGLKGTTLSENRLALPWSIFAPQFADPQWLATLLAVQMFGRQPSA